MARSTKAEGRGRCRAKNGAQFPTRFAESLARRTVHEEENPVAPLDGVPPTFSSQFFKSRVVVDREGNDERLGERDFPLVPLHSLGGSGLSHEVGEVLENEARLPRIIASKKGIDWATHDYFTTISKRFMEFLSLLIFE